jgi:hypothetical protein
MKKKPVKKAQPVKGLNDGQLNGVLMALHDSCNDLADVGSLLQAQISMLESRIEELEKRPPFGSVQTFTYSR